MIAPIFLTWVNYIARRGNIFSHTVLVLFNGQHGPAFPRRGLY